MCRNAFNKAYCANLKGRVMMRVEKIGMKNE